MSSTSLELVPSNLLECGMDFRDNWLAHFRALMDQEVADANGDKKAGRDAMALKLEMGEQTLYQYYEQKSGKEYPSIKPMVMVEKKYGEGRMPGWSAQELTDSHLPVRTGAFIFSHENLRQGDPHRGCGALPSGSCRHRRDVGVT